MSDGALPLCACEQYYDSHHPECPARRAYEGALLKLEAAIDQLAERDADLSLARHDYATLLERWREEQQHILHWRTRAESAESRLDQFCKLAYDISGQQHRDERYWCVWPDQMRKLDDMRREHRGEETARIVETSVTVCTCPHEGICEYGPQDPRCGRNDRWFEVERTVTNEETQ